MENLDIKDFQQVSTAEKLDNLLMVLSNGLGAKITVDLLIKVLLKEIQPSINKDGEWLIGGVTTGISAAGKTPELRTTENGIEWRYTDEASWRPLVSYDLLKLKFSDLTPEQVNELKLKFSDLTTEEIESLKGGQGIQGVTGKSAYQAAQENGYQGTEEQFGTEQATIVNNSQRLAVVEQNKQDKPLAGRTFLTPLFVSRGAVFNDKTGYYELNGLTDITETQMMNIYSYTSNFMPIPYALRNNRIVRTNFKAPGNAYTFSGSNLFANCSIEIINLVDATMCTDATNMFNNTPLLKKILGIINVSYNNTTPTTGIFNKALLLEDVKIIGMQNNIHIGDSQNFNRESILYLINNSANTKVIILTLHPNAKARLTSEDIALASSKNITIA